jgi:hypothetical protein
MPVDAPALPPDTSLSVREREMALLRTASHGARFLRALELTAFVRELCWQGALRHSGALGMPAVTTRFLTQLFPGTNIPDLLRVVAPTDAP